MSALRRSAAAIGSGPRTVLVTLAVVFGAEGLVMLVLPKVAPGTGYLAEAVLDAVLLTIGITPFVLWIERRRARAEAAREAVIRDLEEAIANIKTLRSLLPICMHCKRIRDDTGYWRQMESYFLKHQGIAFSHGLCQKCAKTHYGVDIEEGPTGTSG
jgi:hypothetical protein